MLESKPLVSIGIPVYGVEKYIERCARSLFEQTYQNIEFIFVDDCTPDKSIDKLSRVVAEYPNREKQVRIIHHEYNRGLGGARNTAVTESNGDYITWVDSDDYIELTCIEKMVSNAIENDSDIVSVGHNKLFQNSVRSYPLKYKNTNARDFACDLFTRVAKGAVWGRLIKRNLYIDNAIKVEEGVNMGEDFQVMSKLAYFARKISFIEEPLYNYDSTNVGSYTNLYSEKKLEQDWKSFDVVKSFFANESYFDDNVIYKAEIKLIVTDLVFSSRFKNIDYYYDEAVRRLNLIDKKYWRNEPKAIYVLLCLSKYRRLMSVYSNISTNIKHVIERFK